ncbi:glyoxalase family protein [Gordonia polyisoprenivorans VH2]|uniref:Glyoxalase family protein n=2 Tax=Gordonia polyisoprenivorans TaxID=84595 RepID=H6N3V3_GORPV|nr:VOC family protein [Gordonia polyisoprenivorans]AFA74776.1 glyoxalase family protein [Gordonia polyisoprenivorans VH2]NKY03322.1 glyoxalase [Gordonia polyisoprenivorans]QUD85505.1 VOC family protein [Gordonia polyisoprenivorans]
MNWTLEVAFLPVTDVDRAKEFYTRVGFHPDHDSSPSPDIRFVQMTPPGSGCSIAFGTGIVDGPPPSRSTLMLCVSDIDAAHRHLTDAGIEVSDVDITEWGHFVYFDDPDGNHWNVQFLPYRQES